MMMGRMSIRPGQMLKTMLFSRMVARERKVEERMVQTLMQVVVKRLSPRLSRQCQKTTVEDGIDMAA